LGVTSPMELGGGMGMKKPGLLETLAVGP
jgi:hypothetical protein